MNPVFKSLSEVEVLPAVEGASFEDVLSEIVCVMVVVPLLLLFEEVVLQNFKN